MKITVQRVVGAEDGREEQVPEVVMVEQPPQPIVHLGCPLAHAPAVLTPLQPPRVAPAVVPGAAAGRGTPRGLTPSVSRVSSSPGEPSRWS
jgi:hypothetical protein